MWRLSGSRIGLDRGRIAGVDALGDDEVEQLLDVERVALGPRGDELDEGVADRFALAAQQLLQLRADELRDVVGLHAVEGELAEAGAAFDAEAAAGRRRRPVGEHEQHGQRRRRPDEDLEQVARQLVDPVAVLEHGDDRRLRRTAPAGTIASRSSSDVLRSLASKPRVRSVSGIDSPTTSLSSGVRATSARSMAASCRFRAAIWRSAGSSSLRPNRRRQISRQTKYGVLVPNAWHSPNATMWPPRRTSRTNSATSRDLPMPASAAMPTTRPWPATASAWRARSSASSCWRPTRPSSNRVLRRDARSSEPLSDQTSTGSALPLTVRSGSRSQMNASPASSRTSPAT